MQRGRGRLLYKQKQGIACKPLTQGGLIAARRPCRTPQPRFLSVTEVLLSILFSSPREACASEHIHPHRPPAPRKVQFARARLPRLSGSAARCANGCHKRLHLHRASSSTPRVGGVFKMSFTQFSSARTTASAAPSRPATRRAAALHRRLRRPRPARPDDHHHPPAARELRHAEPHVTQEGIPGVIPPEACMLGWQDSLRLLALLVEEVPGGEDLHLDDDDLDMDIAAQVAQRTGALKQCQRRDQSGRVGEHVGVDHDHGRPLRWAAAMSCAEGAGRQGSPQREAGRSARGAIPGRAARPPGIRWPRCSSCADSVRR